MIVDKVFEKIDLDGNGEIDFLEFEAWAQTIPFLRHIFGEEKFTGKMFLADAKQAVKMVVKSTAITFFGGSFGFEFDMCLL